MFFVFTKVGVSHMRQFSTPEFFEELLSSSIDTPAGGGGGDKVSLFFLPFLLLFEDLFTESSESLVDFLLAFFFDFSWENFLASS